MNVTKETLENGLSLCYGGGILGITCYVFDYDGTEYFIGFFCAGLTLIICYYLLRGR